MCPEQSAHTMVSFVIPTRKCGPADPRSPRDGGPDNCLAESTTLKVRDLIRAPPSPLSTRATYRCRSSIRMPSEQKTGCGKSTGAGAARRALAAHNGPSSRHRRSKSAYSKGDDESSPWARQRPTCQGMTTSTPTNCESGWESRAVRLTTGVKLRGPEGA
jgi:hypothetical protein